MEYLHFAVILLLAQFSPGPDMLLLLKNAVNHPFRAGLWTVAGIAVGLTVHTTLALTGLSVIVRDSATAARILSAGAGLYLGWLAFQLLASVRRAAAPGSEPAAAANDSPLGDRAAFSQGLITNLLNPKAAVFLLSVLATSVGPGCTVGCKLIFAAIVVGQALFFWGLFVWLLKRPPVRRLYLSGERWLNLLFGLGLLALAVTSITSAVLH